MRVCILLLLLSAACFAASNFAEALASRQAYIARLKQSISSLPAVTREVEGLEARHRKRLERSGKMTDGAYEKIVNQGAASIKPTAVPLKQLVPVEGSLSQEESSQLEQLEAEIHELEIAVPVLDLRRRQARWLRSQLQ